MRQLFVTPTTLERRAEFYYQLAALTEAGVRLREAIQSIRNSPPSSVYVEPLGRLVNSLDCGYAFTEALALSGRWPELDLAILQAGEESGRLEQTFRMLEQYYRDRASLFGNVVRSLGYPIFVLHALVFIPPFPHFFISGDLTLYLSQTFGILIPAYVVIAAVIWLFQTGRGERWQMLVERVFRFVPFLGSARRQLALARLAMALDALLNAGVSIVPAWKLAASASGSPTLKNTVNRWESEIDSGESPGELLATTNQFPEVFCNLYRTGEQAGRLDDSLKRLYRYYREQGERNMHTAAVWGPRLVYFIILGVVAYYVISFWSNYFSQIMDATRF